MSNDARSPRWSGVLATAGATSLSRPDEGSPSGPLHHRALPSTMRLNRRLTSGPRRRFLLQFSNIGNESRFFQQQSAEPFLRCLQCNVRCRRQYIRLHFFAGNTVPAPDPHNQTKRWAPEWEKTRRSRSTKSRGTPRLLTTSSSGWRPMRATAYPSHPKCNNPGFCVSRPRSKPGGPK
jgi:hypothetical protein